MERIPIYILAGGRSQRFGGDKALAMFKGQPLLTHVANALQSRASQLTVVADREDKYPHLRVLGDGGAHRGPLDGLRVALLDLPLRQPWLLLCSCDLVGFSAEWIDRLLAARFSECGAKDACWDAVAFQGPQGRWEPTFALYRRRILPAVEWQLQQQPSLRGLLDAVATRAVSLPGGWRGVTNINTREQLERALQSPTADGIGGSTGRRAQ